MSDEKMKKGIDISHWQGVIDWEEVSKHIDFAFIKAGGSDKGFYKDSRFEYNYTNFKKFGVPVGAYYFVGKNFITAEDGRADALRFLDLLKGKRFEMPVVVDVEKPLEKDKNGITDAVIAFCETMENAGAYVMIYGSDVSGFVDRMDANRLTAYDKWVAKYSKTAPKTKCGIWQYTNLGKIEGINGYVDMDKTSRDYPSLIEKKKLNRF